jgi:hypothetical protein
MNMKHWKENFPARRTRKGLNIRAMKRHQGKSRIRFYKVADDQLENILFALDLITEEADTEWYSVALDLMATHYLATSDGPVKSLE